MYYHYYMCRKCRNKLIEKAEAKDLDIRFSEAIGKCDKCGGKLKLVLTGENRIDERVYKIYCGTPVIADKDECIRGIMDICNCSIDEARQKLSNSYKYLYEKEPPVDSLLLEGNLFDIYLSMERLDRAGLTYYVIPEFPFKRRAYIDCPDCGDEAVYKMERTEKGEDAEDYMKGGWFCEKCREWVAFKFFSKLDLDDTDYRLTFDSQKFDEKANENVKELVENLSNNKDFHNEIMICGKAKNIHQLLQELKRMNIDYKIIPPYPYKIVNYSDEELFNMVSKLNQW